MDKVTGLLLSLWLVPRKVCPVFSYCCCSYSASPQLQTETELVKRPRRHIDLVKTWVCSCGSVERQSSNRKWRCDSLMQWQWHTRSLYTCDHCVWCLRILRAFVVVKKITKTKQITWTRTLEIVFYVSKAIFSLRHHNVWLDIRLNITMSCLHSHSQ